MALLSAGGAFLVLPRASEWPAYMGRAKRRAKREVFKGEERKDVRGPSWCSSPAITNKGLNASLADSKGGATIESGIRASGSMA